MSGDMATDHVNGNGTEEPMDTTAAVTQSEHFPALLEAGLPQKVAEKLDELYVAGKQTFLLSGCAIYFYHCFWPIPALGAPHCSKRDMY